MKIMTSHKLTLFVRVVKIQGMPQILIIRLNKLSFSPCQSVIVLIEFAYLGWWDVHNRYKMNFKKYIFMTNSIPFL